MIEKSTRVVVGTFSDEFGAIAALEVFKSEQKDARSCIDCAAVLRRTEDGTLKISEFRGDRHGGTGALVAGVSGAVVGLLAAPLAGWQVLGRQREGWPPNRATQDSMTTASESSATA